MDRSVRYSPEFHADVLAATAWYDQRNPLLGTDFILKIEQAVCEILDAPERRTDLEYGIRYWPIERFPYVVFYDITEDEILIVGVMHTSQDAKKWRVR